MTDHPLPRQMHPCGEDRERKWKEGGWPGLAAMGLTDTLAARGHAALSAIQPQTHLMHPFGEDRVRKWREAG